MGYHEKSGNAGTFGGGVRRVRQQRGAGVQLQHLRRQSHQVEPGLDQPVHQHHLDADWRSLGQPPPERDVALEQREGFGLPLRTSVAIPTGTHANNGVNEVYWDPTLSSSTLAVTSTHYHCYWQNGYQFGIDETDSSGSTPTRPGLRAPTTTPPRPARRYSFEAVAMHELGYVMGLDLRRPLDGDAQLLLSEQRPARLDPGAGSVRRRLPRGARPLRRRDDRGRHRRIGLEADRPAGTSNLVSSPAWAARGSNTTMEFTFLNQSTSTRTFDIGFYLSANDVISTGDTLLGTSYGASGTAGFTGTFSRSLDIPTWIAPGTYYLGFIVDPLNTLGENNEGNNTQRMPRTITIY